ncbi:IclR family transcriptional regulator [uncultured Oscillibacter sp.]|uniref:IclR family transcriptional regulator n=1 Tax=uncultured Oscillibacter sp. TaxID=876091 RepID=UPI0025EA3588|nr:IclR family transcriptional regulator [uncultured Oscillibacter sp.]
MIQSISRAVQILNLFRDTPRLGLSQIAQRVGLPKTTAFGLVQSLCEENFLAKDPKTHDYSLGIALFELGTIYESRLDLRQIATPFMQALYEQVTDTVQLTVLTGRYSTYISKVVAPNNMTFAMAIGIHAFAHCTASGKVLLAYQPRAEIDKLYTGIPLERPTAHTQASYAQLSRQLDDIRRQGYSTECQEIHTELAGVAVPVFDGKGRSCAALCISFPYTRFSPEYLSSNVPLLKEAAVRISEQLGCPRKLIPPEVLTPTLH